MIKQSRTLVITGIDPLSDDLIYSNENAAWNVSRALRDCTAGKHKSYTIDVVDAYVANAAVEVDAARVELFMRTPEVFAQPLIGIIEGGPMWLIDGHHRLRALHRLGIKECACWVIEEADAAPYQVWFNGKRKPPFKP